jgi:DNA-binding CsgD family transcriptional regulator/PAS domain-containing protein
VNELINCIYDSVSDGSKWREFLEKFVFAAGAERGTFTFWDGAQNGVSTNCWFGWSDDDVALHAARFSTSDPWTNGALASPAGFVGPDTDVCSREEMESSAAWRDFYLPRDACCGFGGIILQSELHFSQIAVVRGAKRGPFTQGEMDLLRNLMPHLQRGAALFGELNGLRSRVAAFTGHIDRAPQAVCMLDAKRRVLYANPAASEILVRNDGLRVEAGLLKASTVRHNEALRRASEAVFAGGDTPGRVKIPRDPAERPPYLVLLLPLPDASSGVFGPNNTALFAMIIDPAVAVEPLPSLLMELFQLTPSEARVASRLAMGQTPEEIAKQTRISIETVRTHLRRIMSKTNTNRQGAVISLILRSTPFHRC